MKSFIYVFTLLLLFTSNASCGKIYDYIQSKVDHCIDDKLYNSIAGIAYDYVEGSFAITKTKKDGNYLYVYGIGKMNMLFNQESYPIWAKFKYILDEVALIDCYLDKKENLHNYY